MTAIAPIGSTERMCELDVLRGFALLGVFIVHFVGAAFHALPMDEAQRAAYRASNVDSAALFVTEYFFYNKANTLFATLFGMGFWVMMERLQQRGDDFAKIYLRRLTVLLLIGLINIFLIFPGDVLHEYAALGFLLFLIRGLDRRVFLIIGLILAVTAYHWADMLFPGAQAAHDEFDLVQKAAFENGGYLNWVATTAPAHVNRELAGGVLFGWALYIFGRFMLGAWIIQQNWIQRSRELLPNIRKLAIILLPAGLVLEGISMGSYLELYSLPDLVEDAAHFIGVLTLAAGYALSLIVILHSPLRSIAAFFAPVGRMALTAYVAHGAIYTLLFFPFGFDLLGKMGPAACLVFAIGLFIAITMFSSWWLSRYRYGPLEYLWRWATYGSKPQFAVA